MQIQLETQPFSSISTDALVTYIFDQENKLEGVGGEIDRAMNGRLASLVESGELTGKALELSSFISRPGSAPSACCWWAPGSETSLKPRT